VLINGEGPFWEDVAEPRSPEQQYAVNDGRVTRTLQRRDDSNIGIGEADRFNAARALLGYPVVQVSPTGQNFITRTLPDAYPAPKNPATGGLATFGLDYLWATSIRRTMPDGKTLGIDSLGAARYPLVRFQVEYSILPYIVRDDFSVLASSGPLDGLPDEGTALAAGWLSSSRYVSRFVKPGGHMYTLPQGLLKRTDMVTGNALPVAMPWRSVEATLRYTWHQVPINGIPENAIYQTYNCVNDAIFDNRPTGTLLFKDVEITQYQNALGIWMADVSYTFGFQPNYSQVSKKCLGWNSRLLYVKTPGGLDYVGVSSNGAAPATVVGTSNNAAYPFRDFTALFRPDQ
jgi:hypothetical protein